MNLKPVKSKSLVQAVIDELIFQIKSGYLKPGDKIDSQNELAKKMNVGRSCIREALQALSLTKIVEIRQGKGIYVSNLSMETIMNPIKMSFNVSKEDLFALLKVRKILEKAAVSEAVVHATEEDIENLEKHVKKMDKYIEDNDSALFIYEDIEFHKSIFHCTHNKSLMSIFNFICDMLLESIQSTIKIENSIERGQQRHKEIFERIKQRDIGGAKKAINNHLDQIKDDIENSASF
jgi:GntR family transcriptional regulator, transcriptional repressor for pyruvate dehydrogenase complex